MFKLQLKLSLIVMSIPPRYQLCDM